VHISGRYAPAGRKIGHAGAIIKGAGETATAKTEALVGAGAIACPRLPDLIPALAATLTDADIPLE
ncbi:MAG: hypothetical protein ACOC6F_02145, partial [bacterium]